MGISVYLKDGEPRINFKNAKPKISRDEILGVVLLFRGEILEVLTETSRPASAKEVAR